MIADANLPLLFPGAVLAALVGLAGGGLVGRILGVRRVVASLMIIGFGLILAATLTPQWGALAYGARSPDRCDFSRIGPPSIADLTGPSDAGPNVLMFVPPGAMIALVPRSRRKAVLVAGAVALPFAIETIQLLVPALDRFCESADVVDNLTGLFGGLAAGIVVGRLAPTVRRPG